MPDLSDATSAINHGCYDEASAVALVSIAQSLETLAKHTNARYGTCIDCHHPWDVHHTGGGCYRCQCTEPRPA